MAYCTQADVANAIRGDSRLTQLADWSGAGSPDASVIDEKIMEASDWIDSYARAHYSVPFADGDVPEIIRRKTAREVIFLLALDGGMVTPQIDAQHAETLAWLEDLARGRVRIALESEKPKQAAAAETGDLKSATGEFDSPDFGGLW
jgi:phage gp36-like protein